MRREPERKRKRKKKRKKTRTREGGPKRPGGGRKGLKCREELTGKESREKTETTKTEKKEM